MDTDTPLLVVRTDRSTQRRADKQEQRNVMTKASTSNMVSNIKR